MISFMEPTHPVVGKMTRWYGGVSPTKFMSFNTGPIAGLAFVSGDTIELMAVISVAPGRGNFRRFMTDLKKNYRMIRAWAVLSDWLGSVLQRYGFASGMDADEYGEMTDVWQWESKVEVVE